MNQRILSALVAVAGLTMAAQADVLWDQSAISLDPNAPGLANHTQTSGFGQREAYGLTDVTVPAGGWTIQSISVYMSTYAFSSVTGATLNVFPKTSALPTAANNPRLAANGGTGTLVPVTVIGFEINGNSGQFANEVTASGLNITLAAGDYWIGLTPKYQGGDSDNQWPALNPYGVGQVSRFAAPLDAGWSSSTSVYGDAHLDGAMKINGTPAPGAMALLGLGGLAAGRRRR